MEISHGRRAGRASLRKRGNVDHDTDGYSGQCAGGPDDGNLVTSSGPCFRFEAEYRRWLADDNQNPYVQTVRGEYVWNEGEYVFNWKQRW